MICFNKFCNKNASGGAATLARSETLATQNKSAVKIENISNSGLAEKLHKPIIKKYEKRKVYSSFMDNILGADLRDMQLTGKLNKIF